MGIFRICANAYQLKGLKQRFNAGEDVDLFVDPDDPEVVAGLVKGYFRESDPPLYPEQFHSKFTDAFEIPDKKHAHFKALFRDLPPATRSISSTVSNSCLVELPNRC